MIAADKRIHAFMLAASTSLILFTIIGAKLTSTGDLGMWHVLLLLPLDMVALTIPAIWWHRQQRPDERDAALVLPWLAVMVYMLRFPVLLSARLRRPFQDALFVKADAALGVSVPGMVAWVVRHPAADLFFSLSYDALFLILPLAIFLPALIGKKKAAQEFLLANSIAFLIALPLFTLLPAIGPWAGYHYAPSSDQKLCELSLIALHQSAHFVDAHRQANCGIVCFPSFHVIWAVLSAVALGSLGRVPRILSAMLAGLIVISTMTTGWHYATDVLGGVIIAIVSLALAKVFLRPISQPMKVNDPPPTDGTTSKTELYGIGPIMARSSSRSRF